MSVRRAFALAGIFCLCGCMSEERLTEALVPKEPAREASDEQDILKWLGDSKGDPDLRCQAVATLVELHARGKRPERDAAVSAALRGEYQKPHLAPDEPGFAEDSRILRAWILAQAGRLHDPRWVPFLLDEGAAALAQPADDGRGVAALRGLAELVGAVAEDDDAAVRLLRLAATAAARPDDAHLAKAGALVAFLREHLSTPARLAGMLAGTEDAAVHAVLVHWGAAALHEACAGGDPPPVAACEALINELIAEEAGRGDAALAAVARAALAERAPLHLVQAMAHRLAQRPDAKASDELAAALLIANEVRAAHPTGEPATGVWTQGARRQCNEAALAAAAAWQASRGEAVRVLLAAAKAQGGQSAAREALLGCLAAVAPAETASCLAEETGGAAPTAADHPRLEQVARHLNALLAAPGVDTAAIHQALARLAAVESEAIHRTAAAALAVRDPAAYLSASAVMLERLPAVNPGLADVLIAGTVAALQQKPEQLEPALRSAVLGRLAGAFRRLGAGEDGRQDRAWACLAPRDPALVARAVAAQLATRIAAQGPSPREVLRAAATLPLVRDPASVDAETALIEPLAAIALRPDEETALFAARALAEQGSPGGLASLRRLAAAQPAPLPAVAALVNAALANQPKP